MVTTGRRLSTLAAIDVGVLGGIGHARRSALGNLGVHSVLDLVTYYPRRYLDRSAQSSVAELGDGEEATVVAEVRRSTTRRSRAGRSMVEVDVFDGSSYLHVVFFNQPWRARQLPVGTSVLLYGKADRYKGRRQMANPVVDLIGDRTGRIVPLYPQSDKEGITSWDLGVWIGEALERAGRLLDPLPERWRRDLDIAGRDWALRQIHAPESMGAAAAARKRLAFDELLRLQLILVMRKRATERDAVGIRHPAPGELRRRLLDGLPFPLTGAQRRAIAEIDQDLAGPHPMHRLLQGDVGAGKTLVAVSALLAAVEGGRQGALMAPTEVLAEQHYAAVRAMVEGISVPAEGSLLAERPLRVALFSARAPARERARRHEDLERGQIDVAVGTHALLSETVAFRSLGVAVIDEQHRFGVEQRAALREKGGGAAVPDVLVMTATPIPRTAAMTVYGDLDTTVLDELPPGRTPIQTRWARGALEEEAVWQRVRDEAAAGRQAYVVCPLIEGSERVQARSASEEHSRLAGDALSGLRLGLLHGQLTSAEKEQVMGEFRTGALDVLVATTVIEVGVDVPNATVMVIEDADRFGIAQLHQLRGRVGRGGGASWCYLLGAGATAEAEARLGAVERCNDGFELAETDLELRGAGTILGARQKGATDLKAASLRRDKDLVAAAREVAFGLADADPGLACHPDLADEVRLFVDEDDQEYLFKS